MFLEYTILDIKISAQLSMFKLEYKMYQAWDGRMRNLGPLWRHIVLPQSHVPGWNWDKYSLENEY